MSCETPFEASSQTPEEGTVVYVDSFEEKQCVTSNIYPEKQLALGICICIAEVAVAADWAHSTGIIFSCFVFTFFVTLLYEFYHKKFIINRKIRYFGYGIGCVSFAVVLMLFIVRIWSSGPVFLGSIPIACHKVGCTKISYENPQRGNNRSPLIKHAKEEQVIEVINAWFKEQRHTIIIEKTDTFLHARTISSFFGFTDDTGVQLQCVTDNGRKSVMIEMYAEPSLGVSDFGVNDERLLALLDYLEKYPFIPNNCTSQNKQKHNSTRK